MKTLLLLIFFGFALGLVQIEASVASPGEVIDIATDDGDDPFSEIASEILGNETDDIETNMRSISEYESWRIEFVKRSFEWHLLSTKIIFFFVIFVVVFGVFISWLQFRHDILPSNDDRKEGGDASPSYDISASAQSISIKSKTIGALILVFSGVFFFLYISIVYPMNAVDNSEASQSLPPAP